MLCWHASFRLEFKSKQTRERKKEKRNNQRTYFGPFKNIFINVRCQRPYEIKRNVNGYISFIMQPIRHFNDVDSCVRN